MVPFKVDVSEIVDAPGTSVEVDGAYDIDVFTVGEEHFALLGPAVVDVVVSNVGSGLVTTGTVSARIMATCSRCLCEFESEVLGEVEGFYVARNAARGEDQDAERVTGDGLVDLASAIVAALVVETPFVPLHDPKCAGLCTVCGADLNEGACGCSQLPDESHPFSTLRGLLIEDDSSVG